MCDDPWVHWTHALEFALAALLIELTPGPNMTYLAVIAASRGRRAGLVVVAGTTLGLGICMLASVLGVAQFVLANPSLYAVLRWGGVGYLGWLALDAWRQAPEPSAASDAGRGIGGLFVRGLTTNILNIKSLLFYAVVMPEFIDRQPGAVVAQALLLGTIHLLVSIAVHSGIIAAAGARPVLGPGLSSVVIRRGFAVALAASAVWLAWVTR